MIEYLRESERKEVRVRLPWPVAVFLLVWALALGVIERTQGRAAALAALITSAGVGVLDVALVSLLYAGMLLIVHVARSLRRLRPPQP